MPRQHEITLEKYLRYRLGEGNDMTLLKVMVRRSFGASSFAGFWRYWNPLYGYYLDRLCYRPLRTFLPRFLCVIATFALCGFLLHDLPFGWSVGLLFVHRIPFPFITVWFVMIGIVVVTGEAVNFGMTDRPFAVRASLNTAHIILPFVLTIFIAYLAYAEL
jgi:hypothetical protein